MARASWSVSHLKSARFLIYSTARLTAAFGIGDELKLPALINLHWALPTYLPDEKWAKRVNVFGGLLSFPHVLHES